MSKMKRFADARPIMSWDDVPIIFDIPIAARLLGKSYDHIVKRCQNGEIPAFKDGKEWRFEREAFQAYIRANTVTAYQRKG